MFEGREINGNVYFTAINLLFKHSPFFLSHLVHHTRVQTVLFLHCAVFKTDNIGRKYSY
jgi:hypothetical protein